VTLYGAREHSSTLARPPKNRAPVVLSLVADTRELCLTRLSIGCFRPKKDFRKRPAKALAAVIVAMCEAVALELDLSIGRSGERNDHVRAIGRELTGAKHATRPMSPTPATTTKRSARSGMGVHSA
jgi:hypothetical protein